MLPIKDINGNEEFITNIKGLTRKRKVNGEKVISFYVVPDKSNEHCYDMVDGESIVEFDGEEYVIKVVNEKSVGERTKKKVEAVHTFFNDMINKQQYKVRSGSMTFNAALTFVFEETGYSFVVQDSFLAESFENFGRSNRLSLFKTILERYGAEFYVNGKTVFLKREIGVKTDFQYRYAHNVKTIDKQINTRKLASFIRGFGGTPDDDGNYPIEEEYISPNIAKFDKLEAEAVYDERITTVEGMQKRLRETIIDEPQISITIDIVDLRAAGYNYHTASEGDYGFIIYEPMDDLNVEARIVEIEEEFDYNLDPIRTIVVLSNIRHRVTDIMTRFSQTSKSFERLINGQSKLPYSVLDDAVKRATEMLLGSATELEYTNNGIVARSKTNPNHLVLVSAAGVGVSVDGGQTFRNAITAEGIVADLITVGTMLFDRIRGGNLILGGHENINGKLQVLNASGEVIADLDGERGGFSDLTVGDLYAKNIYAPNLIIPSARNIEYFVRGSANGSDDNTGEGGWDNALYSIQEAINRIPKYYDGQCTIRISSQYSITEVIRFEGFTGAGTITLELQDNTIRRRIFVTSCNLRIVIQNGIVQNDVSSNASVIENESSQYLYLENIRINGNGQYRGLRTWRGGTTYIANSEIYNVERCVDASSLGRIHLHTTKGNGTIGGMNASSSGVISGSGTAPTGNTYNTNTSNGGQIIGNYNYPSDPDPTPPPPPPSQEETQVWNASSSGTWRENFGGQWHTTDVMQGKWEEWGLNRGCWFFGSSPSNAVTGKTIKRIRLYLSRANNSGNSGSVNAIIRAHGHTSQPTGMPNFLGTTTHSVGFRWGEGKWITLPSSFHSLFQNGSAKGIMIFTTSTSNSNYMRFSGTARIEITYE